MIFENSRYENDPLELITDAAGVRRPAIIPDALAMSQDFDYDVHTVHQGERLDQIAHVVYGDGELWWILARANPEVFYPDEITAGTIIRIPYAGAIF